MENAMSASKHLSHLGAMLGQEAPPVLIARPSRDTEFAVSRLTHIAQRTGTLVTSTSNDGFGITVFLSDYPAFDLSIDGRVMRIKPARAGEFHLHDLSLEIIAHFLHSFDAIYFYIPRAILDSVTDEYGMSRLETLHTAPGDMVQDAVVQDLSISLLPSLQRIEHANRLFMDHIGMALLVHLAQTYGHVKAAPAIDGKLAPWRQRRAEEMIVARLDGRISLEELSGECDLPRSEFVRAYRRTTGRPPHRRLLELRIERACSLLLETNLPLANVAAMSGFADLNHFTRIFTKAMSVTPEKWRRIRRS